MNSEINMALVKAAKKYFDILLHLSFQKRRYIKQYKNVWDRKKDLTTLKKEDDTLCVKGWKIVPTSPFGTCIKDEKSPDDTECKENEKKIWKLSSYIKVIRKYAKKYKHQF